MNDLAQRLKAWKSSTAGVALGGIAMYAFSSMGCTAPTDWKLWGIGLVTALPGLLSRK